MVSVELVDVCFASFKLRHRFLALLTVLEFAGSGVARAPWVVGVYVIQ